MNIGKRISDITGTLLRAAVLLNSDPASAKGRQHLADAKGALTRLHAQLAPKNPDKKSTRAIK